MIFLVPAVLTTKQCHDYVGGSRVWDELLAAHSDILKPFRTTPRGDSFWRRETVDTSLRVAEKANSLIHQPPHDHQPAVLIRQGRRFKPGHLPA
jgi:hypothetical protein